MKRGKVTLIAIVVLLTICFGACSKQSQDASNNTTSKNSDSKQNAIQTSVALDNTSNEVNKEANSSETSDGKVVPAKYNYEHELNIPNDNYQTYYEVFLYSFCDSDGDGIGDINGLISKLDYINDLGFKGIWLMPIMQSTTYHKYDVVDYYSIDKEYGTLDDFKRLIAECDKRGIKVILDLVINHSSSQNAWFQSAVKSLGIKPCGKKKCSEPDLCREHNPYCKYYNFSKGKPKAGNYYPTGVGNWYYEGDFWSEMPDFNLADKKLRKELEKVMNYWLDLGVGGFRLDAALRFYPNDTDKNNEVIKWVTDYVKNKNKSNYVVAEVWTGLQEYVQYYKSGIDSVFDFVFGTQEGLIAKTLNYKGEDYSGQAFGKAMINVLKQILDTNPKAIDAPFFTNHDTGRAAGYLRQDPDKIKMAAAMNLFMNGNVFVYYGEEIGMSGTGKDENKRAPMNWSNTDTKGMTKGPEAMETVTHKFGTVEEQMSDPLSIYNYYKRAIRIRNENPEIARGELAYMDDVTDTEICAITKSYKGSKIEILYNFNKEPKEVTVSKATYGYEGIRGYLSVNGEEVKLDGETLTMPAYSIVVLK